MKKPTYEELEERIRLLENELEQNHKKISLNGIDKIPEKGSDDKYRIFFDNLSEAIALHKMIIDEEGNIIDFTYEDLNPAREKMINQSIQEIKKLTVRQANPDIDDALVEAYGKTALTGIPVIFEYHSEVYNRDLVVKLFSHKYGYLGTIIEDVTEQKKAREQLRLNEQKLRQLNLTKDKLFSIIAHDLRGPFNSILGFSQLLRENIRKYKIEESEKYLDIINSSARNTLNLLVNLLNWANNQTGQTAFCQEILELRNISEEVVELSSSSAKIKDISINLHIPEGIRVYADKHMLKTILQNLVINAIKFSNPSGIINISARTIESYVEVTVSDNGIGITRKILKNLFEWPVTNTTVGTSNETGSGLGLVICREFVEKHNGKIWVEGKPGKGSDFKFTLPGTVKM